MQGVGSVDIIDNSVYVSVHKYTCSKLASCCGIALECSPSAVRSTSCVYVCIGWVLVGMRGVRNL